MNDETECLEFPVPKEAVSPETSVPHESPALDACYPGSPGEMSLALLRLIAVYVERIMSCLERAPWMAASSEVPATKEPVVREIPASSEAAQHEPPATEESAYPTWILTDSMVAHLEKAIEAEQRVRGSAYGG